MPTFPRTIFNLISQTCILFRICPILYVIYLIITINLIFTSHYQIHFIIIHSFFIISLLITIIFYRRPKFSKKYMLKFNKKSTNTLLCIGLLHIIFDYILNFIHFIFESSNHGIFVVTNNLFTALFILLLSFIGINKIIQTNQFQYLQLNDKIMKKTTNYINKKPLQTIKHKLNSNHKTQSENINNKCNKNTNKQSIKKLEKNYKNIVKLQSSNQYTIQNLRQKMSKLNKENRKLNGINMNLKHKIVEMNDIISNQNESINEMKYENNKINLLNNKIQNKMTESINYSQKIKHKNKYEINKTQDIIRDLQIKCDAKEQIVSIYKDKSDELHKENNLLTLKLNKCNNKYNILKNKNNELTSKISQLEKKK
eukprot:445119_1